MFKVGNEINSLTHFVPVFPFINDDDGDDDDDDDDDSEMMNGFCDMVDRRKAFSLISS